MPADNYRHNLTLFNYINLITDKKKNIFNSMSRNDYSNDLDKKKSNSTNKSLIIKTKENNNIEEENIKRIKKKKI